MSFCGWRTARKCGAARLVWTLFMAFADDTASLFHPTLQYAPPSNLRFRAPQHSGRRKDPSGADKQALSTAFASRRSLAHSSGVAMRAHTEPAHIRPAVTRADGKTRPALISRHFPRRSRAGAALLIHPALQCALILSQRTYAPPSPRYTERPDRLQFMAGQVGLYSDHINLHYRPDSSRPQAARSRVACAKRCGRGHCPLRRGRSGRPGR